MSGLFALCFAASFVLVAIGVCKIIDSITLKQRSEFDQSYMLSNIVISIEEISLMFDALISECFMEYQILEFAYKTDKEYINSDTEKEIITSVSNMVFQRMTEAMIARLSLIYNIIDSESLSDIIAKKVYIKTIDFVVGNNKSYNDEA